MARAPRRAPARPRGVARPAPRAPAPPRSRLAFDRAERALLRRACSHYRAQLPIYLQSAQAELRILERILGKL